MPSLRNPLRTLIDLFVPSASTVLLGFRYITSRWIAWLSVLGFAVGVLVLIVVTSVMNGFVNEIQTSIRSSLSDLIVRYRPEADSAAGAPDLARLREVLGQVPGIRAESISPRISWLALIGGFAVNGRRLADDGTHEWSLIAGASADSFLRRDETLVCQVVGIDFETDRLATNVAESLRGFEDRPTRHVIDLPVPDPDDPFFRRSPPDPALVPAPLLRRGEDGTSASMPAVLGAFLARRIVPNAFQATGGSYFHRGSELRLLTFNPEELREGASGGTLAHGYRSVVMVGTFRTGTYDLDKDIIFLDRRDMARNLLEMEEGWENYFTELVVRSDLPPEEHKALANRVRKTLDREIPEWRFSVSTWQDEKRNQLDAINYEKKMMLFILFFIILIAGINMFTTLWMLVTEKTRDVGIISALGVSRLGVLQLFLTMGAFITLIGEVLGFVGGMLIVKNIGPIENFLFETFGFKMFDPTVYIFDHLPADADPEAIAIILIATFVASVIFSAAPALRAALKHPVQALRYE